MLTTLIHLAVPGHTVLWHLSYYVRGTQLYANLAVRLVAA
jgi:hypothetical protein